MIRVRENNEVVTTYPDMGRERYIYIYIGYMGIFIYIYRFYAGSSHPNFILVTPPYTVVVVPSKNIHGTPWKDHGNSHKMCSVP